MNTRRLIPLFPLPIVQFPGATTPLHIFEPRYRKMLRDVLETDRTFGIIYQPEGPESSRARASVGCLVKVVEDEILPDGRSNIVCVGIQRFRVLVYVGGEPYQQAEVELFDDEPVSRDVGDEVTRLTGLLRRAIALSRRLGDDPGTFVDLEDLPVEASQLSSTISCFVEPELGEKQELLELVDAEERLIRAGRLLEALLEEYEQRIFAREVAGRNGHAGHSPDTRQPGRS